MTQAPSRDSSLCRLCCAALLALGLGRAASGQDVLVPLPPVIPPDAAIFERPADALAMVPPSADGSSYLNDPSDPFGTSDRLSPEQTDAMLEPGQELVKPPRNLPPGAKDGLLQWFMFRKTYLARGEGPDGFGMVDLTLESILAVPFFTIEKPLLITPNFAAHLLQGPSAVDLPPQVYDVQLEFRMPRQLSPRWGMELAVAPGVFSDFHNTTSKSLRVTGRGVALFQWTPEIQIAGGVAYLDRDDIRILPVGGLIWAPDDRFKMEAIFPRPKVAGRFFNYGKVNWWGYVAGELGGNSYAIARGNGVDDVFTYRDLRVSLGVERKKAGGSLIRWELGYVFDREIEFLSGTPGITPPETIMFRTESGF